MPNKNPTQAHEARRKGEHPRRVVSFTADASVLAAVDKLASDSDISRSQLINDALKAYLAADFLETLNDAV